MHPNPPFNRPVLNDIIFFIKYQIFPLCDQFNKSIGITSDNISKITLYHLDIFWINLMQIQWNRSDCKGFWVKYEKFRNHFWKESLEGINSKVKQFKYCMQKVAPRIYPFHWIEIWSISKKFWSLDWFY